MKCFWTSIGTLVYNETEILHLDSFQKLGKPAKIASYFGGKAGYLKTVKELEKQIYQPV